MGPGGRILSFALAVVLVAVLAVSATRASSPPVLHLGSHGKRVKNLQWLLSAHKPSRFRNIHTYRGKIDGQFGKTTAAAVYNMKFRLGYPKKSLKRTAGKELFDILLGHKKRPKAWVATAGKRWRAIVAERKRLRQCRNRIAKIANSQVGVHEVPYGSNTGYFVSIYQSVTGAYHAPWCASFAQWVLYKAGKGPIANRSASVFYIEWWARARGYLRPRPGLGTLVLFLSSQGHMGIVTAVGPRGFTSVEGNYSNSVARVFHPYPTSYVTFVYLPNCS